MRAQLPNKNEHISRVRDLTNLQTPLILNSHDYIKDVLFRFRSVNLSIAGVVDADGKFVGILTEKDILRTVFGITSNHDIKAAKQITDIEDMQVRHVMVSKPKKLYAHYDIESALDIMVGLGLRYMPVVEKDNEEKLLGLVDERELAIHVKYRLERLKEEVVKKESLLSYFMTEPYGRGYSETRTT